MILSQQDVIKRAEAPFNKAAIQLAVFQDERLLLHTEPILEKTNLPFWAYTNFTNWWQGIISTQKQKRVEELIGTPLATVDVTRQIIEKLKKFVECQDRYVYFNFVSEDYTNDYNEFLKSINDDTFWKSNAIDAIRNGINSIVVIDLPQNQGDSIRPRPYKYLVPPRNFIDIEINKYNGKVEYFIYSQNDFVWDSGLTGSVSNMRGMMSQLYTSNPAMFNGKKMNKCIAIDDIYYRILVKQADVAGSNWMVMSESEHGLGYCPCIDFWQPSIKGTNGINKIGPITTVLRKLDYILLYQALADYFDLYGAFPILAIYSEDEQNFDDKDKQVNTGDNYSPETFSTVSNVVQTKDMQSGNMQKLIGPGSTIAFPIPSDKSDHNFMENPMKFISMDVKNLDYVKERLKSLKLEVFEACTGDDKEYKNELAKNEQMLFSSFNDEDNVLTWVKKQIERVHRFVTDTTCELRYGKEYYLGCTIDYGSDYFLKDSTTLIREFKAAMDSGMPQSYCYEIARTASVTRFKNNPDILARQRILFDIEPYPLLDMKTIQLMQIDKCDELNFVIKANFINFVKQFELENGSIVEFGEKIDYSQKIGIIKQKFIDYAKGIKWVEPSIPQPNNRPNEGSAS